MKQIWPHMKILWEFYLTLTFKTNMSIFVLFFPRYCFSSDLWSMDLSLTIQHYFSKYFPISFSDTFCHLLWAQTWNRRFVLILICFLVRKGIKSLHPSVRLQFISNQSHSDAVITSIAPHVYYSTKKIYITQQFIKKYWALCTVKLWGVLNVLLVGVN